MYLKSKSAPPRLDWTFWCNLNCGQTWSFNYLPLLQTAVNSNLRSSNWTRGRHSGYTILRLVLCEQHDCKVIIIMFYNLSRKKTAFFGEVNRPANRVRTLTWFFQKPDNCYKFGDIELFKSYTFSSCVNHDDLSSSWEIIQILRLC